MIRNCSRLAVLLGALCLPLAAFPAMVHDLYLGEVDVRDHSATQLRSASREGLAQVLVKVSGNRAVLADERVRQALSDSQRFLLQYQYERDRDGDLKVLIRYDEELVTRLLADAQQPLWSANRPPAVVWLVVDDGGVRRFATEQSHPALLAEIRQHLRLRGVPAVFPLHDIPDSVILSVHEAWQMDELAIARASRRYAVDDILVGRLSALSGERWMGDWLYLYGDTDISESFYGLELDTASSRGVAFLADHMGGRYAVAAGLVEQERVLVRVDALDSYADYRAALRYLASIELVDAAWPSFVSGNTAVFTLVAKVQAEQLHRVIALNRRLDRLQAPAPLAGSGAAPGLSYRWQE